MNKWLSEFNLVFSVQCFWMSSHWDCVVFWYCRLISTWLRRMRNWMHSCWLRPSGKADICYKRGIPSQMNWTISQRRRCVVFYHSHVSQSFSVQSNWCYQSPLGGRRLLLKVNTLCSQISILVLNWPVLSIHL